MNLQQARHERRRRSGREGRAGRRGEPGVDRQQELVEGRAELSGGDSLPDPLRQVEEPAEVERRVGSDGSGPGGAGRWVREGLVSSVQGGAIERLLGPGNPDPGALEGLVDAGVIIRSQATAIQRAERAGGHGPAMSRSLPPASGHAEPAGTPLGVRLPRIALDARKLGAFLAAIAFLGLVWALAAVIIDAFGTPRRPLGAGFLDAVRVLAGALALIGGRRMYRGADNGKPLLLIGLVLYGVASVLLSVRRLADPVSILLALAWGVAYYVTATSRSRPVQTSAGE
jgi:hypothetical protein